ncbi:hypothetical protein MMC25_000579 [Agyrium rufum]|nr:hypothetical protein [Agyrium rufum]
MPRKGRFDKSNSTTYALLHRPQNDPNIYDDGSSSMVFQELGPSQPRKIKNRTQLESELFGESEYGSDAPHLRDNEGEAAEYGIYYDDTEYDYMQHLRDVDGGDGQGERRTVEAQSGKRDAKGKEKMSLEDALRNAKIGEEDDGGVTVGVGKVQISDPSILPSKRLKPSTYQDQQDVPDTIAGFQPDMDPRLREVLEALDDEAYVDDEEDLFGELVRDREELDLDEFEGMEEEMEDGWESDDTAKPKHEYKEAVMPVQPANGDVLMGEGPDHGDGDWMAEFSKAKRAGATSDGLKKVPASNADVQSSVLSGLSTNARRKKRKGAMTSSSGYSMSSASLARTEGLTLLDARFDKIEEEYGEEEDGMDMDDDEDGGASIITGTLSNVSKASARSNMSSFSTRSEAPSLVNNPAFDGIMDEFLEGYSMSGKRRLKKGKPQTGMAQLDEIRRELGRPRVAAQRAG